MLFISLISLIIAIALPNINISPILFTRLTSIIFIYSAALSLNAIFAQCIGSGIAIYSGLFQVTFITQSIETFIYLLGALILIPWASILLFQKKEKGTFTFFSSLDSPLS